MRQTRDGVLVLLHDATIVDHTTDGAGTLRDLTLTELGGVRAVTGAGGGAGSEPVPMLGEGEQGGACELAAASVHWASVQPY